MFSLQSESFLLPALLLQSCSFLVHELSNPLSIRLVVGHKDAEVEWSIVIIEVVIIIVKAGEIIEVVVVVEVVVVDDLSVAWELLVEELK